ncbi:MAG TPA: MTH938/NDUFAF3 family protein [Steroidobacteraceae bacterium]|nr:MTH938/NDUFAF3 family protein [Steroidobacteraceae bacterium]
MQITREPAAHANAIVACLAGEIRLRDARYTRSLIVTRDAVHADWEHPPVAALTIAHFRALIDKAPEIILLGTGPTQQLPPPELYAAFAARGIGLEAMDNPAACRTYNLLLAEYREVAVALMLEAKTGS